MGVIYTFKEQLLGYLSRSTNPGENVTHLVKFDDVSYSADFSFIHSLKIWINYINIQQSDMDSDNILVYATNDKPSDQGISSCKKESEKFVFQIEELTIQDTKCSVKLVRNMAFKTMLQSIASSNYAMQSKQEQTIAINVSQLENSPITNFRLTTIALVLKNLLSYSQYTVVSNDSCADHKILLTTRSNSKKNDEETSCITILCSVVRDNNENNKKISHLSTDDYFTKRINDMHLMALHKYGVRAKSDDNFLKLRERLGEAACKLDMIEVKNCNAMTLMFDPKQAFILYNSARIESLLKSFDEKVSSEYYPKLPDLEDIDLNLLTNDQEWVLLKQMMLFPETVHNAVGDFKNGKIYVHQLYKYLQNLAIEFSNYYSKKRILTENRPQLIPVMHAKIHLLKAIQTIFNKTLGIFDIEPVSFM